MEKIFRSCVACILIAVFLVGNPAFYARARASGYGVEPPQKISVEVAEKRITQFIAEIRNQTPGDTDLSGLSFTRAGSSFTGDKVEEWEKKNAVPFQPGGLPTEALKKARREWLKKNGVPEEFLGHEEDLNFFAYHTAILRGSLDTIRKQGYATESDMDALERGMQEWRKQNQKFRDLLQKAGTLQAGNGSAANEVADNILSLHYKVRVFGPIGTTVVAKTDRLVVSRPAFNVADGAAKGEKP